MDFQTLIIVLIFTITCFFIGISLLVSSIRNPGAVSKSRQTKQKPGMEGEGCGCVLIIVGLFGLVMIYFILRG